MTLCIIYKIYYIKLHNFIYYILILFIIYLFININFINYTICTMMLEKLYIIMKVCTNCLS